MFISRNHNMKQDRFCNLVQSFIERTYPDHYDTKILQQENSNIEDFDRVFWELFKIHKYKYKYDLHRALKEADHQFKTIINKIFQQQLEPRINSILKNLKENVDKKNIDLHIKDLLAAVNQKEKKFKKKSHYFSILWILVSLIDIIISVGLIVMISMIAHRGDKFIQSVILGIIFVTTIALLKVTLDRFWIIPNVHKLWRKMYVNNIKKFKSDLAKFEGISLVIMCSINRSKHPMSTIDLLKRGVHYMQEE